MTVSDVFCKLVESPRQLLLERWNWKSAVFSSVIRAAIFFFCNLTAGRSAAFGAMLAEFSYRLLTAGFCGALTQAFRKARPVWAANIAVMIVLPFATHSLELCVHVLRGTPRLLTSLVTSVCFTIVSSLFNLYAMQRGALIVGEGSSSVVEDLRRVPALIGGFLACGPLALHRRLTWRQQPVRALSSMLVAAVALAPASQRTQAADTHYTRVYHASAVVSIMSITIFNRSGVGGGFASLDESGAANRRSIRLQFLSGSTPERAHGLNRAGFIEERVQEANHEPASIDYFGFITANREKSLADARAALDSVSKDSIPYVAAESTAAGDSVRYSVRNLLLPARYHWTDSSTLLAQAAAKFKSTPTPSITTHLESPRTAETFLYALTRAIQSGLSQSKTPFLYNGKMYELRTEQGSDERTGEEFQHASLVASGKNVVRLKGSVRAADSQQETVFRLWFDRASANPLPLRFEFRPKSYLKLVFDAQPGASAEPPVVNRLALR